MNVKKKVFEYFLTVIDYFHASDHTFDKRLLKSRAFCGQKNELVL